MAKYRSALPQLQNQVFLTDSGLETTLVFHDGYQLDDFAAFVLLADPIARGRISDYFRDHAAVAAARGAGFVYESPTWRASADWGARLGYDSAGLAAANRDAIELMAGLRDAAEVDGQQGVLSGCLGPRGDGYDGTASMSADQAMDYHFAQIQTFADTEADMVNAMTLTYPAEAIGVVRAAQAAAIPAAISFTVETDGALPDRTPLSRAITEVDRATDGGAAYFAVNCAHPSHFQSVLEPGAAWAARLRGIRANASRQSHTELDQAEVLDSGDPEELAEAYRRLRAELPRLTVLGGCCGTDLRHVQRIAAGI